MAEADFTFVSTDFYLGQYLSFPVPDSGAESTVQSHSAEFSGVTGTLQRRTSDPDPYVDESDENQDVSNTVSAVLQGLKQRCELIWLCGWAVRTPHTLKVSIYCLLGGDTRPSDRVSFSVRERQRRLWLGISESCQVYSRNTFFSYVPL